MTKHLATALQVLGTTIITMSIAYISVPASMAFAGVALVVFGVAVERN